MASLFQIAVRTLTCAVLICCPQQAPGAFNGKTSEEPRKLKVSGYGLFGNRDLRKLLRVVQGDKKEPFFSANEIEDAAFLLISQVRQQGHLRPEVSARLTLPDGETSSYSWTNIALATPLPRELQARTVHFHVNEGIRYRYGELTFEGLTELRIKEARKFFVETGVLIPLKRTRIYTPQRLQRGLSSLTEVLNRRGYENAEVSVSLTNQNDLTGRVDVRVAINEKRQSIVRSIRTETFYHSNTNPAVVITETNRPYSRVWLQDFSQLLRMTNYHLGYPDTTVSASTVHRETVDDSEELDLLARVHPGPPVFLHDVRFEGLKRSKQPVLDRRVRLHHGETNLLDRVAVEQGRTRLTRLGIFDSVDLRYEPVGEQQRDVIYSVREGKRIEFSLLAGYGSYEKLRGGFELERFNIFGRAHHDRLRVVQSFKSSSADYIYSMPEFVGENVDVFFNAAWLQREEISFTRKEFGGGAGARKYFRPIASEIAARYQYEILDALDTDVVIGPRTAGVGAFIFDLKHDQRDHPLYPRDGYKLFTSLELASQYLASDVDFERFELAFSWHQPLDEGRWLHFGLSHGFVFTGGEPITDLPFNKRFFPGGENSVRGYQYGEAAPRRADGKIIGAESYMIFNIEFEQAVTGGFSLIALADTVGFAQSIGHYPFDDYLASVGGGLRWKTVIGPVRLEYGHNLNRRPADPDGTLHFSLGFPF